MRGDLIFRTEDQQLKQIAVASRPYQLQNEGALVHFVDQQPVRLNMAFTHILVISGVGQIMVTVLRRQRLLGLQDADYLFQLFWSASALDRQFIISFKPARKLKFKH